MPCGVNSRTATSQQRCCVKEPGIWILLWKWRWRRLSLIPAEWMSWMNELNDCLCICRIIDCFCICRMNDCLCICRMNEMNNCLMYIFVNFLSQINLHNIYKCVLFVSYISLLYLPWILTHSLLIDKLMIGWFLGAIFQYDYGDSWDNHGMRPIILGYFFPTITMEISTFHFRTSMIQGG